MGNDSLSSQCCGADAARLTGPTIESVHRDIAFANQYRMELIKYLLAIAAALFAFTVTFRPMLTAVQAPWAMWLGWGGLGVSMVGGLFHMLGWDHFYKSYLDHDWRKRADPDTARKDGKEARTRINVWRRLAMYSQFAGFIVGVTGVGVFAGINIDNVRKPDNVAAAPQTQNTIPAPVVQTQSMPASR